MNASQSILPAPVWLGTHHKTGTNWIIKMFREICAALDLHLYEGGPKDLPAEYDVFFQDHSRFDFSRMPAETRGLHLVRDPRDIIVSGCFYHQKSSEEWLHIPQTEYGGLTYQQKINSLPSLEEQLLFEMEQCARWTIEELSRWSPPSGQFMEVHYEDLIADQDLLLFHRIFTFLGFGGEQIPTLLQYAWKHSLFSGNIGRSVHVRSGASSQWQSYFQPQHRQRFEALFPHILEQLNYPPF